MTNYQNKVIWITGASSGIGKALSLEFSKLGAKVVISARKKDELEKTKKECQGPVENILVLPLDLEFPQNFPEKTAEVLKHFGTIDMLINNGGISQRSKASETKIEVDERLIKINYIGTVALTKAVLPHFLKQRRGHFVAISSLVGKFGTPVRSSYSASKHALHGFFDSLRAELFQDNIDVTIICPGFIKTNISLNALTSDGTPQNSLDTAQKNGMSAEVFAQKAIRALAKRKCEVYIGGKEISAVYLKRLFPNFFAFLIRRAKVT